MNRVSSPWYASWNYFSTVFYCLSADAQLSLRGAEFWWREQTPTRRDEQGTKPRSCLLIEALELEKCLFRGASSRLPPFSADYSEFPIFFVTCSPKRPFNNIICPDAFKWYSLRFFTKMFQHVTALKIFFIVPSAISPNQSDSICLVIANLHLKM